jgi:hypothetical protein
MNTNKERENEKPNPATGPAGVYPHAGYPHGKGGKKNG